MELHASYFMVTSSSGPAQSERGEQRKNRERKIERGRKREGRRGKREEKSHSNIVYFN